MAQASGLTGDQLTRLRATFDGPIITPADGTYDDARRLWNAVHDRRPAVIVQPRSSAEVATAIRFAREHDLALAVRSGGHSPAGHSTCDGGLVIDLSQMRGVTVDPATRTARANGGAFLGELDVAAQAHGLVCPVGVIGHTGVAGLTLGGGVGRLQRQFGLTIDNLRAVELVTADGRFVRASETEEPELFWGMRGAGWNFGIVTAFEFGLHPFGPDLHRGVRVYPGDRRARGLGRLRGLRGHRARRRLDDLRDRAGRCGRRRRWRRRPGHRRPGRRRLVQPQRRAEDVERDTAGLRRGPEPLSVSGGSQPYLEVQTAHDLAFAGGHRSFIKGLYANVFRPEALDALVDHVADGSGRRVVLGHRPGRRDRPGRRGRDGVRGPRRAVRPQRRRRLGRPRRRRRQPRLGPRGDGARRARRDRGPLRERERRRRPGRDARRSTATPSSPAWPRSSGPGTRTTSSA